MARPKIGYFLYNFCWFMFALPLFTFFILRNLMWRRPIKAYFWNITAAMLPKIQAKPIVWVQAASVGETVVANVIITQLKQLLPDYQILFTTTTPTGQAMAQKLLGDSAIITYFPFDFPWMMKRFTHMVQPKLFMMIETEIWPNAIRYSKAAGAKIAIVNGRISDRSFKRYRHFSSFLQEVFQDVDQFAMQSSDDANRIGAIGATLERIAVSGNSKFDQEYPQFSAAQLDAFRKQYGWSKERCIFTAASTHRGEEEQIIATYLELLKIEPYILILAPRHPNRAEEAMGLLKEAKLSFVRRSDQGSGSSSVLLLDTFGEFGIAYAVADVVFVGGSLVGIGGHNVLEAAAQSKPVIYGPYMHNFRESKRLLEEADAGFTVHNAAELVQIIRELTSDLVLYKKRSNSARAAVLANQGAALTTAQLVADLVRINS